MYTHKLAFIVDDSHDLDLFLQSVVEKCSVRGLHVVGVLQERGASQSGQDCRSIYLRPIGGRQTFSASQELGQGSRGCRLDAEGIHQCSDKVLEDLKEGADLLLINRFGRSESTGRGFRDVIQFAFEQGIPTLTSVRTRYLSEWNEFCEGIATNIGKSEQNIMDWLDCQNR